MTDGVLRGGIKMGIKKFILIKICGQMSVIFMVRLEDDPFIYQAGCPLQSP